MALQTKLPWTASPLIVNAPMADFAGGDLAAAVSGAGGLGMIGSAWDTDNVDRHLTRVVELLSGTAVQGRDGLLPVGVGLLIFLLGDKRGDMLAVLAKHRPAVVWLFAEPSLAAYAAYARELRAAIPGVQVWIQTSSAAAALEIARNARPDVLVMQGADAGGHGWARGAGIVSLVPETRDVLAREGLLLLLGAGAASGETAVAASGGIVDGRGAAAAVALGADAIIMGTRFLGSQEVNIHPAYRQQVLDARDGGQATVRSQVFDELRGPTIWPAAYDGRAIVSSSYEDHVSGVDIGQIRERYAEVVKQDDKGWGESRRAAVWAGTGVGLVNDVRPAADIVREVRDGAKSVLESVSARLR
jgi:nitronate monooxygenase